MSMATRAGLSGSRWNTRIRSSSPSSRLTPRKRGRPTTAVRVEVPDRADPLPEAIRPYTRSQGHGGSHPHLVHEFTRSIVEGRRPAIDALVAADWTAPGIRAHESALRDGERVDIPDFRGRLSVSGRRET